MKKLLLYFFTLLTAATASAQSEPAVMPVVEFFTGTWGGWCPVGIEAMSQARQTYGDKVLLISVHYADPMQASDYDVINQQLQNGYPTTRINRGSEFYPKPDDVKDAISQSLNVTTKATIKAEAVWTDNQQTAISITTNTQFCYSDNNGNYGIAFVLLEDGMTGTEDAWAQTNNLSEMSAYQSYEFWYNAPRKVSGLEYNDVAVAAWGIENGLDGSVKSSFKDGEMMKYSFNADIWSNSLIQDKNKLKVVAMLINRADGEIINATQVEIEKFKAFNTHDVNHDREVNISDIVAVINTMAGDNTFKENADVNGDKEVNISDIVAIINYIANPTPEDAAVAAGICPDENHPHVIDMGEAGEWSCCNVGAKVPWETGGKYAWGETETKEEYNWGNYKYLYPSDGFAPPPPVPFLNIGKDIAGTEYDVASLHPDGGLEWQMPSESILLKLNESCSCDPATLHGIDGCLITAPDGHSIFLPESEESTCRYWSSTLSPYDEETASSFFFNGIFSDVTDYSRPSGLLIRPIKKLPMPEPEDAATKEGFCPDTHHPHVIDMGSAGKWACCNVGASAPWEYGGYYAWGETEEKSTYNWSTYKHCDGSNTTLHDIGTDIAGTQYDVAHVKWQGNWQMPNYDQAKLLTQCSGELTTLNNVPGRKYIGSNGNYIFLPAPGIIRPSGLDTSDVDVHGWYWSSVSPSSLSETLYGFWFYTDGTVKSGLVGSRPNGLPVRPVSK